MRKEDFLKERDAWQSQIAKLTRENISLRKKNEELESKIPDMISDKMYEKWKSANAYYLHRYIKENIRGMLQIEVANISGIYDNRDRYEVAIKFDDEVISSDTFETTD